MKVLFAHDHRFVSAAGKIWSNQFSAAAWQRYLRHFDELTVLGRFGEVPEGRSVAELQCSSRQGVAFEFFPDLSDLRSLLIRRRRNLERMEAIVSQQEAVIARLPSELGLLAVSAARRLGRPWAVEVVGCPWDALWNYGSAKGCLYAPVALWRMRRAVANADHAIYVTREFLQRRYPTRASNTASASNVVLPALQSEVLATRKIRASQPKRLLRLGLIGSLHGRFKGIQTLLAALARQRASLPPVRLHILGAGDSRPWRAEAGWLGISDIVSFDGALPTGEPVLRWLDNIDIYFQPSLQEGLPRALIEAMSRGCPAIASNVAGIPELLPAQDLFRPGDKAALASLLQRRISDKDWMAQRAERNWYEARKYQNCVLEEVRSAFWSSFSQAAFVPDESSKKK